MNFIRLTKFKPLFKKLALARKNIQNRKLLNFKKKKWAIFKSQYDKKQKRYRKKKAYNQTGYSVIKFAKKGNSYKKRYRNTMNVVKVFKLYYGNFLKKQLKKQILYASKNFKKSKGVKFFTFFLKYYESRLDVVLYRAKFFASLRAAQQAIKHGKITVDKKTIKTKSYLLKPGNLVAIKYKFKFHARWFLEDPAQSDWVRWRSLIPKHLNVNYNTFQIILGTIDQNNLSSLINYNLKVEKILLNFYKK